MCSVFLIEIERSESSHVYHLPHIPSKAWAVLSILIIVLYFSLVVLNNNTEEFLSY